MAIQVTINRRNSRMLDKDGYPAWKEHPGKQAGKHPPKARPDEQYRAAASALMEKYGYEPVDVPGFGDDGFLFIKPSGAPEGSETGFDGYKMIKEHFEAVDALVSDYTAEQLQGRLSGDRSVIGAADDMQVSLALKRRQMLDKSHEDATAARSNERNMDAAEVAAGDLAGGYSIGDYFDFDI